MGKRTLAVEKATTNGAATDTATTPQKIYCNYLKNEGFPQTETIDEENLLVKAEGRVYIIRTDPDFPERFALALPSFWPLEDAEETQRALTAVNEVNLHVHGVTVFCARQNVTAVVELFLADPEEDIKDVFYPSLKALQRAVYWFVSLMYKPEPQTHTPGAPSLLPSHSTNGTDSAAGYL